MNEPLKSITLVGDKIFQKHFWINPSKPEPTKATFYAVKHCGGNYLKKKSGLTKNIHEARMYGTEKRARYENNHNMPIQVVRIDCVLTVVESPQNTV